MVVDSSTSASADAPDWLVTMTPAASRPLRFRRELRVTPRVVGGEREYLIEDRAAGRFHLLGAAEYLFAASLNGQRSLPEAFEAAREKMDDFPLQPADATALARWLLAAQIVEVPGSRPRDEAKSPLGKWAGSLLYFRITFGSPDKIAKSLAPWLGWLFTAPALFVAALAGLIAAVMITLEGRTFAASVSGVFAPDHHWRMLMAWLVLKSVHELGHAVACRRFGGEVRDCGIAFFFLAPAPYVDVTSCWRFPSKWDRIAVALAGMYFELIVAIVAAFVWIAQDDLLTRQACVQLISLATVSTILFNGNPLLRFDGYFVLSDLLNWPNLASDGKACVAETLRRSVLGLSGGGPSAAEACPLSRRPTVGLFLYGLASTLWQSATMLGVALFAVAVYEGFGVAIALLIGAPMLLAPMASVGMWLLQPSIPLASRLRGAAAIAAVFALLALGAAALPWPERLRSAGVVEFADVEVVRAASPGVVARLHVADGQAVERGELVATLENPELAAKAELAADEAALTKLRARGRLHQQKLSDYRAEEALAEANTQALEESRRQVEALVIRAPISGVVMARRLTDQEGKYLKQGEELCKVARGRVEVRISVPQRDMERFQMRIGLPVSVRLPSGTVEGRVRSLDPMGSHAAIDRALLAPWGGPLAAKANDAKKQSSDGKEENAEAWTLPEPHFVARVEVDADALPAGYAGQRAEVSFYAWDRTIAQRIRDYFVDRVQQAQAGAGR